MPATHRIVIVGGGFGGLHAARKLRWAPAHITLIDRKNYHLFQPLLYQVATGSLASGDISATLRPLFRKDKNVSVLLGDVTDIDVGRRKVILSDGEVLYDTLVLAPGSEPSYFGHDEWITVAPPLKTIEDATEIRRRWLLAFETAEREPDRERRCSWLRFVIVGGGPTGVELAGALGEIARDTLRGDFRVVAPEEAQIFLIEAAPRILPSFPEELAKYSERGLAELGVRTLDNTKVTGVDADGVTVETAQGTRRIGARTVIWAAGVKPTRLAHSLERAGAELQHGRVVVERDCSLPGHPEIFVIGDMAHYAHARRDPLPGLAAVAIQEGRFVGEVIKARLQGRRAPTRFRYYDKGDLATIGRGKAIGKLRNRQFVGMPAWLVWVFVHLMYLVGFENRMLVLIQWAFYYATFNRRARIITGATPFPLGRPESRDESPPRAA